MKLRSQLILAFMLLAVVPLAGVVGFTYWNNAEALRSALEEETSELTEHLEESMTVARADLRRGLQGLDRKLIDDDMPMVAESIEGAIEEAMAAMGPVASAIEGFRFRPTPMPEGAHEAPNPPPPPGFFPGADGVPAVGPAGAPLPELSTDATQEERREHQKLVRERWRSEQEKHRAEARRHMEGMFFKVEKDRDAARLRRDSGWRVRERTSEAPQLDPATEEQVRAQVRQHSEQIEEQLELKGKEMERAAAAGDFGAIARMGLEAANLAMRQGGLERLLGRDSLELSEGVGLMPEVNVEEFITGVLRTTELREGEIPFALDAEGNLYTIETAHYDELLAVVDDKTRLATDSEEPDLLREDGWLIARQHDESSGLTFGIARAYASSLQEIRARTGRNLLLGFGMIGFSLVGILPLSSRLTRRISSLSSEAERLAAGNLEARVPVRSRDELGQLAQTFNHMASRLQTNQEKLLEQERENRRQAVARTLLESENRRRGEELEEARKFQLAMLPEAVPELPEFEIAVYHRTATEVGGDYYDFAVRDESLTIALGDATGHGARAATLVTVIRTLFLSAGAKIGLADFLREAARPLRSMSLVRMAMSLVLVRLDRKSHRLEFASAGMPPAYLVGSDGSIQELVCEAVPLGALAEVDYQELSAELGPGDTLVLLSDGLPEQADATGEPIGYSRLSKLLVAHAKSSPDEIVGALRSRLEEGTNGGPPSDDVTLLAVRRRLST